ncbi:unnamed protein product [Penicillium pancosmium]
MASISFRDSNHGLQIGDNHGSINAEFHLPADRWNMLDHTSSHMNEFAFKIHRELRRRILITAKPDDLQQAFKWALMRLRESFPHQSPLAEPLSRKWKECGQWISHVMSVKTVTASFRTKLQVPEILVEILIDGAIYLWERGLLDQGFELITFAEEICECIDNCSQSLRAAVLSFKGCILSDRGMITDAIECFRKEVEHKRGFLLSLKKKGQAPSMIDEIQLANGYNNLAGILCACEAFDEADLNNELSLSIKKRWIKKGDLDYLLSLSYSNRANVLGLQKKWSDAARWYQKALEIPREKHYAPRLALIYHNFGTMRLQQGTPDEATKLLSEAVEIRTEELGNHYDTAISLHTLARCYRLKGKLIVARDLLMEALDILDTPHLRDKGRIARSKHMLSIVLEDLGDRKALTLRQEAKKLRTEIISSSEVARRSSSSELARRDEDDDDDEESYDCLVPYV